MPVSIAVRKARSLRFDHPRRRHLPKGRGRLSNMVELSGGGIHCP